MDGRMFLLMLFGSLAATSALPPAPSRWEGVTVWNRTQKRAEASHPLPAGGGRGEGSRKLHPLHVAVTELDYNDTTRTLQAAHKIFTDDLEAVLFLHYHLNLKLGTPAENPKTREYLEKYLSLAVRIQDANGQEIRFQIVGHEHVTEGATWVYLESTPLPYPTHLHIRNEILFTRYEDERNLLHFRHGGFQKSLYFDQQHTEQELLTQ